MNAELLLPAEADVLREALGRWTKSERPAVPAAERLRRIREQLNAAAGKPLYAIAREPKVSRLSWLAAACAAAVLATACAGWLYHALGQSAAPVVQPGEEKAEKVVAQDLQAAPAFEVGTVQECMDGFYRHVDATPPRWEAVAKDAPLHVGDLLQVATNGDTAEVQVFGTHRVRLEPGTTVRLGEDPNDPRVGFYWGRMDAWAKGSRLRISSITANEWDASDVCKLAEGNHLMIASNDPVPASARALQQDGFNLDDPAAMPRMPFSVQIDQNMDADRPEVRKNVLVQQGTANLLNTIDADLQDVPVAEAVDTFVTLLNVRIRLSDAAKKTVGATKINLKVEKLTGAEAISTFCALAGLSFQVKEGEIVLRLPNEEKDVSPTQGEKDVHAPQEDF